MLQNLAAIAKVRVFWLNRTYKHNSIKKAALSLTLKAAFLLQREFLIKTPVFITTRSF